MRPPRKQRGGCNEKVLTRLKSRAKESMAVLNAVRELPAEDLDRLCTAFHDHDRDCSGDISSNEFVTLWEELRSAVWAPPPPRWLAPKASEPVTAHVVTSGGGKMIASGGAETTCVVTSELGDSSGWMPPLGTVLDPRIPRHDRRCGMPELLQPRLSLDDLCTFGAFGKPTSLFERCALRGLNRLDVNEVAVALLIARDEYYLRSALRAATSFDVRDARRARWYGDLVRTGGHLAAARVFRELDADFNCALTPDEYLKAMALFADFGAGLQPPQRPVNNVARAELMQLFGLADLNKDGKLDFNEWLLLLILLAPNLLSLIRQHADSPCGSFLLDTLHNARLAWTLGEEFSLKPEDWHASANARAATAPPPPQDEATKLRETLGIGRAGAPAAPGRPAPLPAYDEDPDVALLIRRCIELGCNANEPRL